MTGPSRIAIVHPAAMPLRGIAEPPSSKNYTTRYILASCLAAGHSVVHHPAVQDDAVALVRCAQVMGAKVVALDDKGAPIEFAVANAGRIARLEIEGFGASPRPTRTVDPDNAGAVLRLLMGAAVLSEEPVRFETAKYPDSLGKRANADLLRALEQLGVRVLEEGAGGCLPIVLHGGRARLKAHLAARRRTEGLDESAPVRVEVSGAVSSQFLSSLLFLAPMLDEALEIVVPGELKSSPLIATTRSVLAEARIKVESSADLRRHVVRAGQHYRAREWHVNGDWPGSAAIFAAAAAVPGSRVGVRRLRMDDEQGERRCLEFYAEMGCRIDQTTAINGAPVITLQAPDAGRLRAAEIDGDAATDAVLAMMGPGLVAAGTSRYRGIANLQFKECDRVRRPIAELRKLVDPAHAGRFRWVPDAAPEVIEIDGDVDGFNEGPSARGPVDVDGCGDHRVIMLLTIAGLRSRHGVRIAGAEHVAKSFPQWFATMRGLGAMIDV